MYRYKHVPDEVVYTAGLCQAGGIHSCVPLPKGDGTTGLHQDPCNSLQNHENGWLPHLRSGLSQSCGHRNVLLVQQEGPTCPEAFSF